MCQNLRGFSKKSGEDMRGIDGTRVHTQAGEAENGSGKQAERNS